MSVRMTMETLGERLKKARKTAGLSQNQIAKQLGVARTTVTMWENDANTPDSLTLAKLARTYNVSVDYLLGLVDNPQGHLKGEVELPRMDKPQKVVPLLGKVSAGQGVPAEEDIIGYISLEPGEQADFALKVKGHSMHPLLYDGDIVFVRKQPIARNGQIAVVRINGEEAVIKKFFRLRDGVKLESENPEYKPIFIKKDKWDAECEVIGVVVSFKRKFPNL